MPDLPATTGTATSTAPSLAESACRRLAARWPDLSFRAAPDGGVDVLVPGCAERIGRLAADAIAPAVAGEGIDGVLARRVSDLAAVARAAAALEPLAPWSLLPRLVPRARFASAAEPVRPELRPFHGDTRLALVARSSLGDRPVRRADLEKLGLEWDEALAIARDNLWRELGTARFRQRRRPGGGEGARAVRVVHPYAGAALLVPAVVAALGRVLGPEMLVCVPSFDEMVALRPPPEPGALRMVALARRRRRESSDPVTDDVFHVSREGVRPITLRLTPRPSPEPAGARSA